MNDYPFSSKPPDTLQRSTSSYLCDTHLIILTLSSSYRFQSCHSHCKPLPFTNRHPCRNTPNKNFHPHPDMRLAVNCFPFFLVPQSPLTLGVQSTHTTPLDLSRLFSSRKPFNLKSHTGALLRDHSFSPCHPSKKRLRVFTYCKDAAHRYVTHLIVLVSSFLTSVTYTGCY